MRNLHVYYSKTRDNKFLPKSYVETLERDLDPKMALRMLEGQWISIGKGKIYHQYSIERNYRDSDYTINPRLPVRLHWDFNIGDGKPLSCCASQYFNDQWHFFDEAVIHTARTEEVLEELKGKGLFENPGGIIIHGDCNGKNRDTRNNKSDYQIIKEFLQKYVRNDLGPVNFEFQVPLSNPEIRTRHNHVNAYMLNTRNDVRLFVYRKAKMLDQGWRLTKLKKGGTYIEDDSKEYQHVTTAAGYGIVFEFKNRNRERQNTIQL